MGRKPIQWSSRQDPEKWKTAGVSKAVLFFEPKPIPGRHCAACGNPEVIRQGPQPLCGACAFLDWRAWVEMLERRHGSPWEPGDGAQPTFSGTKYPVL